MSPAALEEGHDGFGLQERDWWRWLTPWSTGAKANAKRLITLVLVMQFAMPLMPTLWKSTETSFAAHVDFVANLPNCSLKCNECDDSPLLTKLTRPDFVSKFPFRSFHLFYEVEEGAYGERICTRRKPFFTGEYALRDSCPAELEIRDKESCDLVAKRMLPPSGTSGSGIDIQWDASEGCVAKSREWKLDKHLKGHWSSWRASGLKWCFVLPRVSTQALVLAIAFAAAWLIARQSQEQASPASEQEDDDTALRELVAEGSGRMAMAKELGFFRKTYGLLFRMQQVEWKQSNLR